MINEILFAMLSKVCWEMMENGCDCDYDVRVLGEITFAENVTSELFLQFLPITNLKKNP